MTRERPPAICSCRSNQTTSPAPKPWTGPCSVAVLHRSERSCIAVAPQDHRFAHAIDELTSGIVGVQRYFSYVASLTGWRQGIPWVRPCHSHLRSRSQGSVSLCKAYVTAAGAFQGFVRDLSTTGQTSFRIVTTVGPEVVMTTQSVRLLLGSVLVCAAGEAPSARRNRPLRRWRSIPLVLSSRRANSRMPA